MNSWQLETVLRILEKDLAKLGPYKKLVIHGRKDRVISFRLGEDLFAKLPEPKEFTIIDGGEHTDFLWRDSGQLARKFYEDISR